MRSQAQSQGTLDNLRVIEAFYYRDDFENWMKAGVSLLVYLGPEPSAGQKRYWNAYPLDPRRHREPVYASDLTVLKDRKDVLDRAQTYASTSRKQLPEHAFRLPPALANGYQWSSLAVPIDAALEERARKWIASPQDFGAKDAKLSPLEVRQLRYAGVTSLRYFKSEANAEILRAIVKEPLNNFMVDFEGPYSIQKSAYQTLLRWDVDVVQPAWADDVTSLELTGTSMNDSGMKRLAVLKNLRSLDLQRSMVTGNGLKELAGRKRWRVSCSANRR